MPGTVETDGGGAGALRRSGACIGYMGNARRSLSSTSPESEQPGTTLVGLHDPSMVPRPKTPCQNSSRVQAGSSRAGRLPVREVAAAAPTSASRASPSESAPTSTMSPPALPMCAPVAASKVPGEGRALLLPLPDGSSYTAGPPSGTHPCKSSSPPLHPIVESCLRVSGFDSRRCRRGSMSRRGPQKHRQPW